MTFNRTPVGISSNRRVPIFLWSWVRQEQSFRFLNFQGSA
jgi:hypothetical protein